MFLVSLASASFHVLARLNFLNSLPQPTCAKYSCWFIWCCDRSFEVPSSRRGWNFSNSLLHRGAGSCRRTGESSDALHPGFTGSEKYMWFTTHFPTFVVGRTPATCSFVIDEHRNMLVHLCGFPCWTDNTIAFVLCSSESHQASRVHHVQHQCLHQFIVGFLLKHERL